VGKKPRIAFGAAVVRREEREGYFSDPAAEDGGHGDDGESGFGREEEETTASFEAALPHVRVDEQAIEEYEASQGERRAKEEERCTAAERLNNRQWIRGKSSIYVDAFDLALDTVLDEESHLFNGPELALFKHWRELSYETKFL
jgi:Fanconi-associated nuclease 1